MSPRKANPSERTIRTAKRDAEAAHLRAEGLTYPQIAAHLGCAVSNAYAAVQRAIAAVPVEAVIELRQIECDRLDMIIAKLWDIANAEHPVLYLGEKVEGVSDSGPVMTALGGIMRASESKRRLLGLDAPSRQTITVISEDVIDAELRRLEEEIAERDRVAAGVAT